MAKEKSALVDASAEQARAVIAQLGKKEFTIQMPADMGFRPGSTMHPFPMYFFFQSGGMGDMICWMQAIRFVVTKMPWIHGIIVAPKYFHELAYAWLKDCPGGEHWACWSYNEWNTKSKGHHELLRGPIVPQFENLNATGAHLMDCGFAYFANLNPVPDAWNHYPQWQDTGDYAGFDVEQKYAVFTVDSVQPNRTVPGHWWNPIIAHAKKRGLLPVFIGRSGTDDEAAMNSRYAGGTDLHEGTDLRDKTTLTQAANILSMADVVIGLDNGLLHLAACGEAPIIFGYNIAEVDKREPRRKFGRTENVYLTREELVCVGCLNRMTMVYAGDFNACFYDDYACLSMLFDNNGVRWKAAIDRIVE